MSNETSGEFLSLLYLDEVPTHLDLDKTHLVLDTHSVKPLYDEHPLTWEMQFEIKQKFVHNKKMRYILLCLRNFSRSTKV